MVVTDGVPSESAPGDPFDRATYLTLQAAATLKAAGAEVYALGVGAKYTGALGGSDCAPMDCNDAAGGNQVRILGSP